MTRPLHHYREVWVVDSEFHQPAGELPTVLCMVASEFHTGRTIRVWADDLAAMVEPPIPIGPDAMVVAYFASAELSCFLKLGWPMPARILDLFIEFRCATNGLATVCGNGLLGAMAHFGLGAVGATEKTEMRELAMRGGPFNDAERLALLDYCESDVVALSRLLRAMLPMIDLPRALLRGRHMAAVARMESVGVPIDVAALNALRGRWGTIKGQLIRQIDADYGVFIPTGQRRINPNSPFGNAVLNEAAEWGIDPPDLADAADKWFVKGPIPGPWLSVAAALPGKALHVGLALWYAAGLTKQRQVQLTGRILAKFCVKSDAGRRALKKLETACLVTVEQSPGCCPLVTIRETPAKNSVAILAPPGINKAGRASGGTPERP